MDGNRIRVWSKGEADWDTNHSIKQTKSETVTNRKEPHSGPYNVSNKKEIHNNKMEWFEDQCCQKRPDGGRIGNENESCEQNPQTFHRQTKRHLSTQFIIMCYNMIRNKIKRDIWRVSSVSHMEVSVHQRREENKQSSCAFNLTQSQATMLP